MLVAAAPHPRFNPRTLLPLGLVAWFDPNDWSTLFQDSAGTIPVTGLDQPVGLMRTKTGLVAHDQLQGTALKRPTLMRDGDNGCYLHCDGTQRLDGRTNQAHPTTSLFIAAAVETFTTGSGSTNPVFGYQSEAGARRHVIATQSGVFKAWSGRGTQVGAVAPNGSNPTGKVVVADSLDLFLSAATVDFYVDGVLQDLVATAGGNGASAQWRYGVNSYARTDTGETIDFYGGIGMLGDPAEHRPSIRKYLAELARIA